SYWTPRAATVTHMTITLAAPVGVFLGNGFVVAGTTDTSPPDGTLVLCQLTDTTQGRVVAIGDSTTFGGNQFQVLLGFSEQATVFEPGQFGGNTGDAVTVDATIVGFDAISQAGYFLDQVTGI